MGGRYMECLCEGIPVSMYKVREMKKTVQRNTYRIGVNYKIQEVEEFCEHGSLRVAWGSHNDKPPA